MQVISDQVFYLHTCSNHIFSFLEAMVEETDPRQISWHYCEHYTSSNFMSAAILELYKGLHHVLDTFSAYKEPQKQSCQAQSMFVTELPLQVIMERRWQGSATLL